MSRYSATVLFVHVGIVTMSHGITPFRVHPRVALLLFAYKKTSPASVISYQCGTGLSAHSNSHITGILRFSQAWLFSFRIGTTHSALVPMSPQLQALSIVVPILQQFIYLILHPVPLPAYHMLS